MENHNTSFINAVYAIKEIQKKPKTKPDTNKKLCEKYNMDYKTVYAYAYNHSMPFIEALHELIEKHKKLKITDKNGIEYKTKKELCNAYNINYSKVKRYVYNHAIPFIDAVYILKNNKNEKKLSILTELNMKLKKNYMKNTIYHIK